jgi:hypothetical protein
MIITTQITKMMILLTKMMMLRSTMPNIVIVLDQQKEYIEQSEVDWLTAHPEAWVKLCEYWASDEYKVILDRNRLNRKSKPGLHRFGADGFIGKSQRMV